MEPVEKRVVIILADISGYTKFMVENQTSAVHGQQCITFLIETLLRVVDIPLRLQEIEGDALFLYAEDPGNDDAWRDVLAQVRNKLTRFFDAFYEGTVIATDATPCKCAICRNADHLRLKIVVHKGTAVFHKIGGFDKVSGSDVILAHRLLKNSVPDDEYLLMTEAAYADIGKSMEGQFLQGSESYDGFGKVATYVRFMGEVQKRHRDSLYELPRAALVLRAEKYAAGAVLGMFPAMLQHLRRPIPQIDRMRRIRYALVTVLRLPLDMMMYLIGAPRHLLSKRAERAQSRRSSAESA